MTGMVTEIITHFIGHFHINLEPERAWDDYDGGRLDRASAPDAPPPAPNPGPPLQFDDMPSLAPIDLGPDDVSPDDLRHSPPDVSHATPQMKDFQAVQPHFDAAKPIHLTVQDLDTPTMTPHYVHAGGQADETIYEASQTNALSSMDVFGSAEGTSSWSGQADALQAMAALGDDPRLSAVPSVEAHVNDEVDAIRAFDTGRTDHPLPSSADVTMAPGQYIDGTFTKNPDKPLDMQLPSRDTVDYTHGVHGMAEGVNVDLGQNLIVNGAGLIDVSAMHLSMVITGDYYRFDFISQVNTLNQSASVSHSDAGSSAPDLPNDLSNRASFDRQPLVDDGVQYIAPGSNLHVHEVTGNFYDVNLVTQMNFMIDSDLYIGTPQVTHYKAVLGENQQINHLWFDHDGPAVDLLIVYGNYHEANMIEQQNVLLDRDSIKLSGSTQGGSSVQTGGDTLTNMASIADYGRDASLPMNDSILQLLNVYSTSGTISPQLLSQFAGNGTTDYNILIVKGDYYALNVISQKNIVSDSDTTTLDLSLVSGATPVTLTTGMNTLVNAASIVSTGTISDGQYVAGSMYSDALISQANLTTPTIGAVGDHNALAPEVVAFLGLDGTTNAGTDPSVVSTHTAEAPSHQDILNAMLH